MGFTTYLPFPPQNVEQYERTVCVACRTVAIGCIVITLGMTMAVLGYFDKHFSERRTFFANTSEPLITHDRLIQYNLKSMQYLGPAIMGIGTFLLIIACVVTLESRDKHAQIFAAECESARRELRKQSTAAGEAAISSRRRAGSTPGFIAGARPRTSRLSVPTAMVGPSFSTTTSSSMLQLRHSLPFVEEEEQEADSQSSSCSNEESAAEQERRCIIGRRPPTTINNTRQVRAEVHHVPLHLRPSSPSTSSAPLAAFDCTLIDDSEASAPSTGRTPMDG